MTSISFKRPEKVEKGPFMINLQEITVILNAQNLCVTFLKQELRKKGFFIS